MSRTTLFAFVDLKDPFTPGEIAEEPLPGPVLSILAARPFTDVFLFHTPHTRDNAQATLRHIEERYPRCNARVIELRISDPKNYSAIMGALGREVRRIVAGLPVADHSICVSSGTAEMRAGWFLLRAANVLQARLLQVGTPAEPLFGPAAVKDVSLDQGDWSQLRNLVMPLSYFSTEESAPPPMSLRRRTLVQASQLKPSALPVIGSAQPLTAPDFEPHPELEAALQELGFHIHSPKMQLLVEKAAVVAGCDEATLVRGETGTGKDLVARLLHRLSPRRHHKMVTVNCASIPQELAESHLFGHVSGAFTGAVKDREGVFEAANGGTLFLDEIAELAASCQAKLLRALQFGEFERLGSTKTIRVSVRVIAATHRNLASEIANGSFRNDLYQRLNILSLEIPPLRDRPGEIANLSLALLRDINARRQHPRQISAEALKRLETHSWPGNVRELDAVLRRSVVFSSRPVLGPEDILIDSSAPSPDPFASLPEPAADFKLEQFLDRVRTHLILRALEKTGGNQTAAAALLGISKQAVSQFLAGKRR
jgi:transcriptional regulator with AAA-type ATPase domain